MNLGGARKYAGAGRQAIRGTLTDEIDPEAGFGEIPPCRLCFSRDSRDSHES
jgi:hypothetical protein